MSAKILFDQLGEAVDRAIAKALARYRPDLAKTTGVLPGRQLPATGNTGNGYTPVAHAESHATGGGDALAPAAIGAASAADLVAHEGAIASAGDLGHVRVGTNLTIDGDGVLSATGGASGTETPAAHSVPQSGAGGTLDDGWLSNGIARTADLTTETAARTAADAAHAALTTTAHGGIGALAGAQAINQVFAGPASGGAANPAFRALVAADVPALDTAKITTGALPVLRGGTGVAALPAFLANKNGTHQTGITNSTFVKVTWSTEVLDNNANFASSRFTPSVPGTYLISAALRLLTGAGPFAGTPEIITSLYKNGVELMRASEGVTGQGIYQPFLTTVVPMNGSTDYLEVYVFQNTGATLTIDGYTYTTFFAGAWVAP